MRAEGIGMDFSRERAQAYAHRWAFGRNPEYLAFDRLGGDCTSFVSQCLLVVGTGRQILVCAHDEDSDFRPLSTYERQKTRFLHWMLPFSSALPSASGE